MQMQTIDVKGPVHCADFGGAGPTLVMLHGLGGTCLNWLQVGEQLSRYGRVLAPDLPGFGVTPPEGRRSDVSGLHAVVQGFLDAVTPERPALLVGNSLGGAIALLEAARRPERVAGLVLVNPALPAARGASFNPSMMLAYAFYGLPGVGELARRARARRLGPEGHVRDVITGCCADASRVPEEIMERHFALSRQQFAEMPWIDAAYLQGMRSLVKLLVRDREYRALPERITAPALLVHGAEDRVVPVALSRALAAQRPAWTYRELAGLGHIPQMEDPATFLSAVEGWLQGPGSTALELGRAAA